MKKSKKYSKTYIQARDKYLKSKYGISFEDYECMLLKQNESCAVCNKHYSLFKNSLHVDHNHKTDRVRGLLCYYCNRRLIGKHTIESARKILEYLLKYDVEVM